ncbi:hypothetical protein QR680_011947 [Steinernema hermaphroditum]|uniref:Uncharacterized protein n=1 Tax=Steinernema hermaphroditum TaxID=289476 RepID=A0AA39I0B8_9BILA|nr:hypothetical protein QR680_011947 [Steinernema hermaphroditum]
MTSRGASSIEKKDIPGDESISNLLSSPEKRSPSTLFQTLQPFLAAADNCRSGAINNNQKKANDLAAPQPENKVKSGTAYKALEATRPTTVYPCVQALLICPPTRASHPNEPPKPKDLQLRLAIMEQHLATLIIDVVNLAPELEDYINKKAARNPHQAFIGTRTEPGRGPWISKRALIDATRYVMAPRLRNPAGWISAIAEEIREWAENPPLSATRRQELYEELAKTKGSPIVIGKNGRDGTPTAKGEQPLSSQAPGTDRRTWSATIEELKTQFVEQTPMHWNVNTQLNSPQQLEELTQSMEALNVEDMDVDNL